MPIMQLITCTDFCLVIQILEKDKLIILEMQFATVKDTNFPLLLVSKQVTNDSTLYFKGVI